jgi:hypothetical protein
VIIRGEEDNRDQKAQAYEVRDSCSKLVDSSVGSDSSSHHMG